MSIRIQNLNKSYNLGHEKLNILKNLNAEIKTGEIVAVVGVSGSGKSTLLSLLSGLDSADSGEIFIQNQNILKLNSKEMISFRAENIGIIFQQFHLVSHLTAFENVALPLDILNCKYTNDEILNALDHVGLKPRSNHKPSELSGGESQRLAIARALITKPSLLLADEPSGNLDTETGRKVMDLFFTQVRHQKTTTLLVTHDMNLADQCDRKLILKQGQFLNA
jgi:putative ABC transport system ATP-binding protein